MSVTEFGVQAWLKVGSYFRLRLGNRRSGPEGGGRSFKKRKEIPCLLAISPRQRRGARAFNEVGDIYVWLDGVKWLDCVWGGSLSSILLPSGLTDSALDQAHSQS